MKKFFKALSALTMALCLTATALIPTGTASARTNVIAQETIALNDGGYCVVTTSETISDIATIAKTHTKSGQKKYSYYNANDVLCWTYTLHGTFKYDGTTLVSCTDSSHEIAIYKNSWSYSGGSHWESGNTAYGKATYQLKLSTASKTVNLQLSCSKTGVLS